MDSQMLCGMATNAIQHALEYHDEDFTKLPPEYRALIEDEVVRHYPLHLQVQDHDVGLIEIACDAALAAVDKYNEAHPRNHIQQRGFYSIVQNLLAIHLKPALVSGTVPRIDEVVDSQDSPKVAAPKEAAPQASVSKGSAFKGSASKGSASKASAPKTRVSAPKPAVPAADDADLQTGAWTDDEVKLMIRMRVNGASHPRVATTLNRALKGCQLQWGRRMREQHWREFAQGCGATSQQEVEGEDEKEDEEEDEDKEDEEEGSEELEA